MSGYEETAQTLVDRIYNLIPSHEEILEIEDPWDLFKIEGFKCNDLGPSLAQAWAALSVAKNKYKSNQS